MKSKRLLLMLLMALLVPWAANAQTRETQTFNFEDNAIPTTWTNDATYPWAITNAKNHTDGGAYSIKSTNDGVNSSTTSIEATFEFFDEGSISFYCWASCESSWSYYDYGIFYIDGTRMDRFLLVTDWVSKSYEVAAGSHTFKWEYTKDSSDAGGDDCFYVDDIVVDLGEAPACPKPTNLAVTDGSITANEATITWTGTSDSYVVMIGETEIQTNITDFEDQTIPSSFTNDATRPWTVTAGGANGSGYCAIPGNQGVNSSQSDLTLVVTGPCTVSFMAKVSSEGGYDYGRFLIDGTQKMQISGTQDWTAYSYELTEGTHTLIWRYYKDSSSASGSDLFYVDDITIPVPTVSSWTEYTTNNTTYTFNNLTPNTSYQVKVKGNCGDAGYSQETAPISFTTDVACPAPTGLTASNVTAHEATITWTSAADAWQICVNDDEENLINVTQATYTFSGLTPETVYAVKVRTNCGDTYSDWTDNINFTTAIACPAPIDLAVTDGSITAHGATVNWYGTSSNGYVVMIGQENLAVSADFEGQTIPAAFNNTDARPWTVTADGANGSGYCAIPGNQGVNGSQSDLTLEVTLDNPGIVSFMAKISSEGNWDWGRFLIDGTQMMQISGGQVWTAYSYQLTAGTHTLIWRYYKDGSGDGGNDLFYVDDIVVSAGVDSWTEYTTNSQTYTFDNLTPNRSYQVKVKGNCGDEGYSQETTPVSFTTLESCVMPTGVTASNETAHGATISWTSDADAWQICVNDDEENLINVTENTYNFTNLTPETTYAVKVRTNCGNEYSDWTNNTNFTTGIACPAPTNLAVTPESIAAREATVTWEGTSSSYVVMIGEENFAVSADFEDQAIPADFTNSATYPWTVTAGGANGSGYCAIPGNHGADGTSSDLTLEVTLNNPATVSFNAKVSSEGNYDWGRFFIDGTQKMQISGSQGWTAYSYELAAGTHTLIWRYYKDNSTYSNADLFYVDDIVVSAGVDSWTEYTTNAQTYTFENLTPNRHYQVKVKGNCGDEGYSQATAPVSFTTLEPCPAPTGLTASNVTAHEATISWTSAANAWQICVNDDEENLIDVTETTYNFTGLAPETAYTVKVRANCGDDGYSDWTNNVTFTTEEACPMNINNVTVNYITNNEATVAWVGTHDNYQVQTRQIVVSEGSYYDDFENGLDNWTIYQEGEAGGNWSITNPSNWNGSNAAHSGSYVAVARSWDGSGFNADNWLVSPQVTIPASMSYWMKGDADYPETYAICVSITGNAVADFTPVVTYTENPNEWTLVTVDLSAYEGQTGYIAFHQYGYDEDFLWIDDVNIGCATGEWMTVETTDLAAAITGLAPGTPYEYQVRGYCADEDTWTDWTAMATFTTLDICATPENLVIVPGDNTATVTWEGVQSTYKVYWGINNNTVTYGEPEIVEGTMYTIEGLTSGQSYGVKVEGICGDSQISEAVEDYFTTALLWTDPDTWTEVSNYDGNPEQASAPEVINVPEDMTVVIPENTIVTVNQIDLPATSQIIIEEGSELIYSVNVEDPQNPTPAELNQGVPVTMSMTIEPNTSTRGDNNNGYRLIASPVYETIGVDDCGLTANYYGMDLYSFDANYPAAEWRNYKTGNNFSELEIGKGYLYYNTEPVSVTFTGQTVPSNVIYSINLSWSENAGPDGWEGLNLVGNPFTCKAKPNKSFYVLNANGDELVTTPSGADYVAPMTGFFVVADNEGDVCTMTKYNEIAKSALNMTLSQARNLVDVAVVKFDNSESLRKVQLNPDHTKLYMPVEGKDYAVANAESNMGEMPVNFEAEQNGSYTLSFGIDNVNFNYLHLIDNMTGTDVDLLTTPSYTFNAKSSDYASRFKLVYSTGSSIDGDSFGFINGAGNLNIFGIEGEATVQVMDVLGHVLSSETFSGSYECKLNVAPGVYMIRLIQGNDVKVQKIVVR